jgi:hypothetical protein
MAVELRDGAGAVLWKSQIVGFSSVGERPLIGDDGWLSQDGKRLSDAAGRGIESAIDAFLESVTSN